MVVVDVDVVVVPIEVLVVAVEDGPPEVLPATKIRATTVAIHRQGREHSRITAHWLPSRVTK
ncbi:MAG: hypothetical protein ACLQK4_15870 [Acidimicrobiales bacterium]